MKKSIIILGIALVIFANITSAEAQQSFAKEDSLAQTVSSNNHSNGRTTRNDSNENRKSYTYEDSASFNPETIDIATYQKTMEEIIADNNQIIDSVILPEQQSNANIEEDNQVEISIEVSPVSKEKEIEYRILQDAQIIESPLLNTIKPVTFTKHKKS